MTQAYPNFLFVVNDIERWQPEASLPEAARGPDGGAGQSAGLVGGQENSDPSHVLRLAKPAEPGVDGRGWSWLNAPVDNRSASRPFTSSDAQDWTCRVLRRLGIRRSEVRANEMVAALAWKTANLCIWDLSLAR
jgi:hypothetical protein